MDTSYRADVKDFLDDLLLGMPAVTVTKAFGFPAYKCHGKIFAFVGGEGVSLKVRQERVAPLISSDAAIHPFEIENGMVWKSWVFIVCPTPEDYAGFLDLFEESAAYVAG